jgi:hypothetical protein
MTKFLLLLLLVLKLTPANALNHSKVCPPAWPSMDKSQWTWMDRDCHVRTRAELDRILDNHKRWHKKHPVFIWNPAQLAPYLNEAIRDPGRADLSGAQLPLADLHDADLEYADLTGANLKQANLTGADLEQAIMTGANLENADLSAAVLEIANLTKADLEQAILRGTHLNQTDLTGADLDYADLTGADLFRANLTGAQLRQADLSSSSLVETDFSNADLTLASLWYAVFEPKVLPPIKSIARAKGLQTLRWSEAFDEAGYRSQLKKALESGSAFPMPKLPSLPQRWLLWLSEYREHLEDKTNGGRDDFGFLWSDAFHGLQPPQPQKGQPTATVTAANANTKPPPIGPPGRKPDERSSVLQGKYPLIDLRNTLRQAGYSEAELQVNLAYQRHTQSTLGMIMYDWTCEYGAAPSRPLFLILTLAILAIPIYWLGFRHRLFGGQLLIVERQGEKEVITPLGNPPSWPNWRVPFGIGDLSGRVRSQKFLTRLSLERFIRRMRTLIASFGPRLRWEAGCFKAVVFFSLISMINLGFEGFDFGRWVRLLFFREYDLKARGWLRTVSGIQSLVGLGLLALSLLSFFGHPFE